MCTGSYTAPAAAPLPATPPLPAQGPNPLTIGAQTGDTLTINTNRMGTNQLRTDLGGAKPAPQAAPPTLAGNGQGPAPAAVAPTSGPSAWAGGGAQSPLTLAGNGNPPEPAAVAPGPATTPSATASATPGNTGGFTQVQAGSLGQPEGAMSAPVDPNTMTPAQINAAYAQYYRSGGTLRQDQWRTGMNASYQQQLAAYNNYLGSSEPQALQAAGPNGQSYSGANGSTLTITK